VKDSHVRDRRMVIADAVKFNEIPLTSNGQDCPIALF